MKYSVDLRFCLNLKAENIKSGAEKLNKIIEKIKDLHSDDFEISFDSVCYANDENGKCATQDFENELSQRL